VTVSMFEALDALSQGEPPHAHECHEHEDVCDESCSIASAVISSEGVE
jgi:hypothetical protein